MMSSQLSYLIAREKDRTIASQPNARLASRARRAISLHHVPGAPRHASRGRAGAMGTEVGIGPRVRRAPVLGRPERRHDALIAIKIYIVIYDGFDELGALGPDEVLRRAATR